MQKKLRILVAEANAADIALLTRIAADCDVECELHFARDGEEALDAFAQRGRFESMPDPDLILVNPYLPKLNGMEVLRKAKEDERVRRIPIIVFTYSERVEDLVRAYDCGAASYLLKPVEPEPFKQLTETVCEYWQVARGQPHSGAKREAHGD